MLHQWQEVDGWTSSAYPCTTWIATRNVTARFHRTWLQDHVYQPYESDYLPYHEFSLRLSKADIPHLVPILRSVSEADLRRLRLGMAKYYG